MGSSLLWGFLTAGSTPSPDVVTQMIPDVVPKSHSSSAAPGQTIEYIFCMFFNSEYLQLLFNQKQDSGYANYLIAHASGHSEQG